MKKLTKLIIAAALILTILPISCFAAAITDAELAELSAYGIFSGDEDGYRLGDYVTRAEFCKMVCVAASLPAVYSGVDFSDVDASHWAYEYIAAAAASGLINGDENGNFDPDGNITYTDGAKIILQALGYEPFADTMGGYPSGYYFAANQYGLSDGMLFDSHNPMNRKDAAQMLYNALDVPLMVEGDNASGGAMVFYIADGESGRDKITFRIRLDG